MEKCLLGIKCRKCSKTIKRTIVGQSLIHRVHVEGKERRTNDI